jgi:hypothetical protein
MSQERVEPHRFLMVKMKDGLATENQLETADDYENSFFASECEFSAQLRVDDG